MVHLPPAPVGPASAIEARTSVPHSATMTLHIQGDAQKEMHHMKTLSLALIAAALMASCAIAADDKDGWISMFAGKTLTGWMANQNPESWTVRDGCITGDGEQSHLFWMVREGENLEFKAEVKINNGGNSGMYFRTAICPGFPKGYEAPVNTSRSEEHT